ncbi:hypothetical protein DVH24_033905 [Malus domestica]|uniref:Uncharacterized protein n=1 Tax=Malus domestica TaxID=3750 RepID=A0A498KND1_MALDO|nr:hypothetical protein DVH24_033905 [Malus domestica]
MSHPGLDSTNSTIGHPSWDCSCANSLNFGVLMESEASEPPKGLVPGRDENIHIRFRGSTPLSDNIDKSDANMMKCIDVVFKYHFWELTFDVQCDPGRHGVDGRAND